MTCPPASRRGFTLIELVVVMAIVALLASIAAPRYLRSLDVARENSLRSSLQVMRDALDHYAADRGRYPEALEELVEAHYLRAIPADPMTGRPDSWIGVAAPPGALQQGRWYDVRSGAAGRGSDGGLYAQW